MSSLFSSCNALMTTSNFISDFIESSFFCSFMHHKKSTEVTKYDELLVRRLIEKVTVYDERFEVEFKSRAKVDVGR